MTDARGGLPVPTRGSIGFPLAIYVLLLLFFVSGGVTWLIAVIMAYLGRAEAPAWQQGHFRFQIRTFWIGLLLAMVSGLAIFAVIGLVLAPLAALWVVVRCVKGILWLQKGLDVPDAGSWLFGDRRS